MTAHLCIGAFNGKEMSWVEMFPIVTKNTGRDSPVIEATERYELTPEQARLPLNQLKALHAAGHLRKWDPQPAAPPVVTT